MGLIHDLIPVNLSVERAKFAADERYEPQFLYNRDFRERQLSLYGLPSEQTYTEVVHYLDNLPPQRSKASSVKLTFEQMTQIVQNLCTDLGISPLPLQKNSLQF